MDTWKQRVTESTAYAHAKELKAALESVEQTEITTATERECYDRALVVVDAIFERLDNADPQLVNPAILTQIQTPLVNAVSYVNNWIQGLGENYLTSYANTALDDVVSLLANVGLSQDIPGARQAVSSLRRSVARHNQVVEQEIAKVIEKGTDADATIDEKVASVASEFEIIEKNIEELDADFKNIKAASAQISTEQQTAFTKAEADRSTVFNKLVSDKQKELDASLEKMSTDTQTTITNIKKKVQSDEKAAEDAKTRIEEILGIVGEDALISDYARTTKDERSAANFWRWVTVGSLAVAVILAAIFAFTVSGSTPWQQIVTKAFIVLSLGGIAGYAGKQSGEHRTAQREAETMALQLKALKPYLYDLEDANKRDELLVKIANRVFGQPRQNTKTVKSKDGKVDENIPTPQLIDAILELIKKIDNK